MCVGSRSAAGACVAPAWERVVFMASNSVTGPLMTLLCCLALMGWMGLPRAAFVVAGRRSGWFGEGWAGLFWCIGFFFVVMALVVTPGPGFPNPTAPTDVERVMQVLGTAIGGAVEEVWFGPVLVTVLARRGVRWWVIVAVAAVLRGSFHVYYGPAVWGFVVWGAVAALGYYLTGRWVFPFVLHALNNFFQVAGAMGYDLVSVIGGAVMFGMLVASIVLVRQSVRRFKSPSHYLAQLGPSGEDDTADVDDRAGRSG